MYDSVFIESLDYLLIFSILVVLPIMIVWLVSRVKIKRNNERTQIILAAIEKYPNLDFKN